MTTQAARLVRATGTAPRPAPALPASAPCGDADHDLRLAIDPVLAAIVRLAGAGGGAIDVASGVGAERTAAFTVGVAPGRGALSSWCASCDEAGRAESDCVRRELCGHDDRLPHDTLGPVCKHVVAIPLRHHEESVGTLTLWFAEPCAVPVTLTPLLAAVGDLVGTALDNARLARENMRVRLTSERQQIANEVHDSLAQGLTYMRMRMTLLRDAIAQRDELRAHKLVNDVDETLGNSQRRLRELITYFRTRMDPRGLHYALNEIAERYLDRTGIALTFTNEVPDLCLPAEREIEVFHIVQEALANIARHAHAYSAELTLQRDGPDYRVLIEDDGIGLAAAGVGEDPENAGHYGIAIMRERARRLGGSIELVPNADRGARLVLTFPASLTAAESAP